MNFTQALELKKGDRVELTAAVGDYPLVPKQAGSKGTVVFNELGESSGILAVKLDEHHEDLTDWDNELHFFGPNFGDHVTWESECELRKI